ncbi:MAG: hypothetical protein MJE68_05890, partial [Proteobacteria bacterium]|nr:hypothetical protein [Pseudomonadota bacterium]
VTYHASVLTGDDLLREFWELKENSSGKPPLSPEEHAALGHSENQHYRTEPGGFVVPLPKHPDAKPLGESRSQAIRRFTPFERSLHAKGIFPEFKYVIDEYLDMEHAELVPETDLEKPPHRVFYLPIHAVTKESSTTTKVRAVFDTSARTSTGELPNDTLMVGLTVHSSLIDVPLRFQFHRVALVADVSRMYRAIALTETDKDLHQFVWRSSSKDILQGYHMTHITFGVSDSSFVANMCVRQNALDFAAKAVEDSFYVDGSITGADSNEETIEMHRQSQNLFEQSGLLLRKWNSSEATVLEHIDRSL